MLIDYTTGSVRYAAIGPIDAELTTTGSVRGEAVTVVAFGWRDAEPQRMAGVWVFGADGLMFVAAEQVKSLKPHTPAAIADRKRTERMAARAMELALRALGERDDAVGAEHAAPIHERESRGKGSSPPRGKGSAPVPKPRVPRPRRSAQAQGG